MVLAQEEAIPELISVEDPQDVPPAEPVQELEVEIVGEEKGSAMESLSQLKTKVIGWFSFVASRNYLSAAKNLASNVLGLKLWIKIAISVAIVIIALIVWASLFKDSKRNNMRRARKLHKKAKKAHDKGDEDKATALYQRSAEYREKAQEQW